MSKYDREMLVDAVYAVVQEKLPQKLLDITAEKALVLADVIPLPPPSAYYLDGQDVTYTEPVFCVISRWQREDELPTPNAIRGNTRIGEEIHVIIGFSGLSAQLPMENRRRLERYTRALTEIFMENNGDSRFKSLQITAIPMGINQILVEKQGIEAAGVKLYTALTM